MNFFRLIILKRFNVLLLSLISIFSLYSLYIFQFQYDGHHVGLMYSNALDLKNGKIPFKEIFIQYGILTTLIHSIILDLFSNKVFMLNFITLIFYQFSILLITLSVKNLINKEFAIISYLILIMNHPIPWLPWSNYIAFFFITFCIFLLTQKKTNYIFLGFFLSLVFLSRQDYLISIIISSLVIFLFLLFNKKILNCKNNIVSSIVGFCIPTLIFIIYLLGNDIIYEWLTLLSLPKFYIDIYNTTILELIYNFIIFFISESFFNFILTPQYFLISIILILNTILIFLKIFKKIKMENNIFFTSIICLCLSSMTLKIELFRIYTSVSIGIIPLLWFINSIDSSSLKKKFIIILILPSLFSFVFYPMGNNPAFSKTNFQVDAIDHNLHEFNHHKWPLQKINSLVMINKLTNICKVDYLENLTFDAIYSTVGNFDRIRFLPYVKSSMKDSKLSFFLDKIKNPDENFVSLINRKILKENIILLINEGNYSFDNHKIIINSNYNMLEVNLNTIDEKPDLLRIYFPKKCGNKI